MGEHGKLIGGPMTDVQVRPEGPPTGPMPALLLEHGHVQVGEHGDVTVLTLDGGLDADFVDAVLPTVVAAAGAASALVVDLDQVTLLDEASCVRLIDRVRVAVGDAPMCVAASRVSARAVLERWGVAEHVTVFGSVADALQLRAFADSGYGTSW